MKKNKKSQTNQFFVYILSIIIILFVGFLVVKFIIAFTGDTEKAQNSKIYNDLEKDFKTVYTTYGAEKVLKYRLSSNVKQICFISKSNCINSLTNLTSDQRNDSKIIFSSGNNVILFGEETIINSQNIGNFEVGGNGCLCLEIKNNLFSIIMENNRNEVYIKKIIE